MFDPAKITERNSRKFSGDLLSVARVPDSQQLWVGGADGIIRFVDLAAEDIASTTLVGHTSYVSGLAILDGVLVSCGWDKRLVWWDLEKKEAFRTVNAHHRWIRQLAVSPDRRLIATVSDDMSCKLWNAASGQLVRELRGHATVVPQFDYPNKLYACAFSPDGQFVATADELCEVIVWDVAAGKLATRFSASAFYKVDWDRNNHPWGGLRALAFSPVGQRLALGGMANTDVAIIAGTGLVQIVDGADGTMQHEFKVGNGLQYESLRFHPCGTWLLAASGGGNTRWIFVDPNSGQVIHEYDSKMQTFDLAIDEAAETIFAVGRQRVAVCATAP